MKIRIVITALILVVITAVTPLIAQKSVQSVMTIRAEVVSGTQINTNLRTDISDQLQRHGLEKSKSERVLEIGSYSIIVPEGVEYIASSDSVLSMTSSKSSFELAVHSEPSESDSNGGRIYQFTGVAGSSEILAGHYKGEARTVIEYE